MAQSTTSIATLLVQGAAPLLLVACSLLPVPPCPLFPAVVACAVFLTLLTQRESSHSLAALCWDPPISSCRATSHDTFSRVGSGPSLASVSTCMAQRARALGFWRPLPASVNLTKSTNEREMTRRGSCLGSLWRFLFFVLALALRL
ncbi:hypothetical protein V8C44DRAFT_877 [Trichoderma aethiopicum]